MVCLGPPSPPLPSASGPAKPLASLLSKTGQVRVLTGRLGGRRLRGAAHPGAWSVLPPLSPIPSLPPWGARAESCSRGGARYIRLEASLSAPPRALKAPWTLWTCGEAE